MPPLRSEGDALMELFRRGELVILSSLTLKSKSTNIRSEVHGNDYEEHINYNITEKSEKVKVTLVQALRLCTGRTAHRGSRGIALPFHDHGTRRG